MLVSRYTLRAHRAAWLLGAGEDADDVVQEAFVKAFRSLPKFRAGEPFVPWLLSIVANETKNLLRSRHRRNALALRLSTLRPDAATPDTPFDEAAASERRPRLLAAVNALPDRERQALVCRYFLDLSEAETAQVLQWPLGSVKSRTSRAWNGSAGSSWPKTRPGCSMAESSGPRHGPQWRDALVSELRALSPRLDVPPGAEQGATVRQRLEAQQRPQACPPLTARWRQRILYRRWRAALIVALTFVALAMAIPQSRAVITHVLRLDGVELRQTPGPSPALHPSLPGEQRMPLEQARQRVAFPVLVPAKLGLPVTVSDGGRVATLIYDRTPYGQVRLDEFDGHLDPVYFEKFVHLGNVTEVRLNGTKGLWVTGPQKIVYVRSDGTVVQASARLTTGSTLIWGAPRVVLRLEGGFGKAAALAVAASAR